MVSRDVGVDGQEIAEHEVVKMLQRTTHGTTGNHTTGSRRHNHALIFAQKTVAVKVNGSVRTMGNQAVRIRWSALALIGGLVLSTTACSPTSTPVTSPTASVAPDATPCSGPNGVGGPVPAGLAAGDIVSSSALTAANSASPGFPLGASIWRILYVTSGVDETDLQLVCGTVSAPTAGPTDFGGGTGHLLNWTHGTVGLAEDCLPSSDPATLLWGKMSNGINTVAWASGTGKHEGDPSGGLLQYALNQGMMVTAADYQPNDTYVVGMMEASASLDAARAGTQLMNQLFAAAAPSAYDMFVWGHSQGGHAALWTGQLAETYLAATTPSQPTATLNLIGVAALAPAGNFITLPGQPDVAPGDGLADWETHQNIGLDVPIASLQMQIGPALFAYIFGSWSQLAAGAAPSASALFPAYPATTAPLDLAAMVTATPGTNTVSTVENMCLVGAGMKEVQAAVSAYGDAKTNQMLVPSLWNLPTDYKKGQYFKAAFDTTCATTSDTGIQAWCSWMTWNLPGPLGTNPFPKAPSVNGTLVPLFLAQGTDDTIVHCVSPQGSMMTSVPLASDCTSRAIYDAYAATEYCPASGAQGHLELNMVRKNGLQSPASHFSIPGEISAKGLTKSTSDLVFEGSPLQKFMTAAFAKTTTSGCSMGIVNPL